MSSWACRATQEESKNRVSEEYDPKMVKKDRHYDDYYRDDYRRADMISVLKSKIPILGSIDTETSW